MSVSSHLSAQELLVKGLAKTERVLPGKGAKSSIPTGSWIEETQIQEALELRKQLLADERVEKWGCLARAEWEAERGLARVTEQRGGHWNYMGHFLDKQLYLYPEEAIYLMETNCLELNYSGITMSLQQAYATLLNNVIGIREYKVYSELSRVGYKILRASVKSKISKTEENNSNIPCDHSIPNNELADAAMNDTEGKASDVCQINKNTSDTNGVEINNDIFDKETEKNINENKEIIEMEDASNTVHEENKIIGEKSNTIEEFSMEIDLTDKVVVIEIIEDKAIGREENAKDKAISESSNNCDENVKTYVNNIQILSTENPPALNAEHWKNTPVIIREDQSLQNNKNIDLKRKKEIMSSPIIKIQEDSLPKLKIKMKPLASLKLPDYFQNISNIIGNTMVTVSPPEEDFLPRHVFLHKNDYTLNLADITSKQNPTDPAADYEIEQNTRTQIQDNPVREAIFQQQQSMMRQFNLSFFIRSMNIQPRFGTPFYNPYQCFFRPFPGFIPQQRYNLHKPNVCLQQTNESTNQKKLQHMQSIRKIAYRLRKLKKSGQLRGDTYLNSLKKLVAVFNGRYGENLEITGNITLLNDCGDTDTVTLDDDDADEPRHKKRRKPSQTDNTDKMRLLQRIKTTAFKLKQLRNAGEHCFRNRRSLIEAIKVFNKKFDMSISLRPDFKIVDAKQIVVDSSSDSDCVITEERSNRDNNKEKCTSENNITLPAASTNKHNTINTQTFETNDFYSRQSSNFLKWLPESQDWGRAEMAPSFYSQHRIIKSNQDLFIYEYLEANKNVEFKDWEHLKSDFWATVAKNSKIENIPLEIPPCDIEPLLSSDDCVDIQIALERVRIIKAFSDTEEVETDLRVAFDLYERDVKNFKKSKPPVPVFRVVCLDEGKPIPDISQVLCLAKQHEDSAPLVLAVVGANISYVLITPNELPVYVKKSFV